MRKYVNKKYLVDLTNQLIKKNRYDDLFENVETMDEFVTIAKNTIVTRDIANMKPETLGKIMCSFDHDDVNVTLEDIAKNVYLSDCDALLREMVAYLLSCLMWDRLIGISDIPFERRVR